MPTTKLSVSFRPNIISEIEKRVDIDRNVSGATNKALDRYFALLGRARAELRASLSVEDCALILDATNGTAFADTISLGMLWAEIQDACNLDGLGAKWGVDGEILVARIKASGIIGQAALIDASERWWRRVSMGESPAYAELLDDTKR